MPSLKNCTYIYEPAGQAGEYAPLACNPYAGCSHSCSYCYVPRILRGDRAAFYASVRPREHFRERLLADARKYQAAGVTEQVMLSFTSDPYHPEDSTLTRWTLEQLAGHGLAFCTLSKGGSRALRDLSLFRPERDAYAASLTSVDDAFSAKWEPGAAPATGRIATLKRFHEQGVFTWVSLEPTLDLESSLEVVHQTHGFVDLFKIGRANYLPMTTRTDWQDYTLRMIDLCQRLGVKHYIKKDLQKYLPPGYFNPMRVPQNHATAPAPAAPRPGALT